jgi:hypothetical protein
VIAPTGDTVFDMGLMNSDPSPTASAIASAILLVYGKRPAPESHQ